MVTYNLYYSVPHCDFFCARRDEIAGCSEKGYDCLSISDAKQMFMFSSDKELQQYITEVKSISLAHLVSRCEVCDIM
jgi:hypothetical protein